MKRNVNVKFNLSDEEKKHMLKEIERFYLTEREEKIGIIGCQQILDFFLEELGCKIYNKALDDTLFWYKKMQDNLESDYYTLYKE